MPTLLQEEEKKENNNDLWNFLPIELNLGDVVIRRINNLSVINLEKMLFNISGFSKKQKEQIDTLLKKSRWTKIKKNLGYKLASEGSGALILEKIEDKYFILNFNIIHFKRIGDSVVWAEGWSENQYYDKNINSTYPTYYKYYKKNNKVYKSIEYEVEEYVLDPITNDSEWKPVMKVLQKWTLTNLPEIPIQIFENNEVAASELAYAGAHSIVDNLNYFSNELAKEWLQTKTLALSNKMVNQGIEEYEYWRGKERGYLTFTQPDTQSIPSLSVAAPEPSSLLNNLALQDYYERALYKACLSFRNPEETSSNKHNTQISTFYNDVIEYLDNKREIREQDYSSFFVIVGKILFKKELEIKVKIPLSPLMKNLIKASDPHGVAKIQAASNEKIAEIRDKGTSKIKKFFGKKE